jgi:hypothetical protein
MILLINSTEWFHVIPCDSKWFRVIPSDSSDSVWFQLIPCDSNTAESAVSPLIQMLIKLIFGLYKQ